VSDSVLVIGGGIAGIQSALDLADAGAKVYLVEREATIGGLMAVLDKNFPTLDCSICIEAPKMSEVELHPNIEILSLAEVVAVEGEAGDFRVEIRRKSRFISDECTRCGDCTAVCPVVLPNEFDSGMAARRAIYTPIPQSVPGTYLVDIARIGYDMFDPREMPEYGYGSNPNILTALEFERLINSAGPTGGEIIRPSDGEHPQKLLFVLCVGSRDQRYFKYCSRFCCMYSIKHAYQAIDHGIEHVDVLYMDVRAFGKGFDGFWQRTQMEGARFIRGRPARITANGNGSLQVLYEDTELAKRIQTEYDMVVLANAVAPQMGLKELADTLDVELDQDGFMRVEEIQGGLVMTTRPGIYLAGCVSGPKDIPDSVSEGSAASALALSHLTKRSWPEPIQVGEVDGIEIPRVGVFVCHCGSNIAGVIDVDRVVAFAQELPDVVFASHQMFSCAGNTQQEIEEAIKEHKINRVVIAACSPKTHESIFRGVMLRAGLNPYLLEMANIRNMDSWVHKHDKDPATRKANDMVWMAVEKARLLTPLQVSHLPVIQSALVIGGGIGGMTAAIALANQGFETHLVEKQNYLGGLLNQLDEISPANIKASKLLQVKSEQLKQSSVLIHLGVNVESIGGVVGNFQSSLDDGTFLEVGAIIIASGSEPYQPEEFNYGIDRQVITNLDLESILKVGVPSAERITFIACVGSRQDGIGCSRYCCTSMLAQALRLRRLGKKVRVLYKEMRTYSRHAEELYEAASRAGVQFFRYHPDQPPQAVIQSQDGYLEVYDQMLGAKLRIPTDLVVLVLGLRPTQDDLADQLKLSRSDDGFYMELHPKLGPVQTAVQGVYLAGASQGAKDIRETMAGALAAAGKAGALLAHGTIEKEPLTARLIEELCSGCMRCVKVCPYSAIEQIGPVGKDGTVKILEAACMGCGTCAAECNFSAIEMPYFTKEQILAQLDATLEQNPEGKCVVFTCNWCSYAGADLAGIEKRQYPPSSRIIRTMCSARFEEEFIAHSFEKGAGAVLVTGCRLTETGSDCHYNNANQLTWKRFQYWQRKFKRKGIEPERLQLRWISAAEGEEFAEKMGEMDEVIQRYLQSLEEPQLA
jgi:heterodisulfide reductase subunit A